MNQLTIKENPKRIFKISREEIRNCKSSLLFNNPLLIECAKIITSDEYKLTDTILGAISLITKGNYETTLYYIVDKDRYETFSDFCNCDLIIKEI